MSKEIRPILRKNWRVYKLTDQKMQTYGGYKWKLGEPRQTRGEGDLCGPGWLHVYSDPRVAVLLNPIHAQFRSPRLFSGIARGAYRSDGSLKAGVSELTLTHELGVPNYTPHQIVVFAILCAQTVLKPGVIPDWDQWATDVLAGRPLNTPAAKAAEAAAWAAGAAAWAGAAAGAAGAAARAAERAAERAAWAEAAGAAGAAARAAEAAWAAAWAGAAGAAGAAARAAWAAKAAARAQAPFLLIPVVNRLDAWITAQEARS